MGGDVFQGPRDGRRDWVWGWWWGGQDIAYGLVAILIGDVGNLNGDPFRGLIAEVSAGDYCWGIGGAYALGHAGLLGGDAILGFVAANNFL